MVAKAKIKLAFIVLFLGIIARSQDCTSITYPEDNALEIPVDVTITWPALEGINGYLLSLGTTPGGTDIVNRLSLGLTNSYKAPLGLPENTRIYISLSVIQFNTIPVLCSESSFTTTDVTSPPPCTVLIAPDNEASFVTIVTDIVWDYAPTATGYLLSIGTSSGGVEILDNFDAGNTLSYDPPRDLPQGSQIYIRVIPTNENGSSGSCEEESFFTGPGFDVCQPVFDEVTGETTVINPELKFPALVGICSTELPYIITSDDEAEGFRWFKTNLDGTEELLSEERSVPIVEPGRYILEAYNTVSYLGFVWECSSKQLVTIVTSETAVIDRIEREMEIGGRQVTIFASGNGNYEYALNTIDGPYQDSPIFENVSDDSEQIAYVRDKNGCGIAQRSVDRDVGPEDFPKFFTPNGDGFNDFWQFIPPPENLGITTIEAIFIFNRFGNLIQQIGPESPGWDGTVNGRPLPSSDYWFKAIFNNQSRVTGHFSLKR